MARILGNMNWAAAAVKYAQAHYRNLQRFHISYSRKAKGNLDASFFLSSEEQKDLKWWISGVDYISGRPILFLSPEISIYSDASLTGWGAVCLDSKTGGPWTEEEREKHINYLELLVALRALQCFTETASNTSVEIQVDNTSAVSYINRLGGSKSKELCEIALQITHWCEIRNLSLTAVFIPGRSNMLADAESRRPLTSGDWKLDSQTFNVIRELWKLEVDLFASCWNAQLPNLSAVFRNQEHGERMRSPSGGRI